MKNGNVATVTGPANAIPKLIPAEIEGEWTVPSGDTYKEIMALFGTQDRDAFALLLGHLVSATGCVDRKEHGQIINQIMPLLHAINPADELESMVGAQMISVHFAAMKMTARALKPGQTMEGINNYINLSTKLTRTFLAQVECLDKRRGKGQQKMTVEHVHVGDGGQAVIGNIRGGRDENKK